MTLLLQQEYLWKISSPTVESVHDCGSSQQKPEARAGSPHRRSAVVQHGVSSVEPEMTVPQVRIEALSSIIGRIVLAMVSSTSQCMLLLWKLHRCDNAVWHL